MHTLLRLASASSVALLVACGSSGSSSSGTVGATSSASSTDGSTTTSTSTSSSSGSGGSGGSGGAGGGPCSAPYMDLSVDNAATIHMTSGCAWDTMKAPPGPAQAYIFSSQGKSTFYVEGCETADPTSLGVVVSFDDPKMTGTFTVGFSQYKDAAGMVWGHMGDLFIGTLMTYEPVTGSIDGDFTTTATEGMQAHQVHGKYHLCRTDDILAP